MEEQRTIENGKKCWRYWHGMLSIVTVLKKCVEGNTYIIRTETGMEKGKENIGTIHFLYRFPEDKSLLLEDLDKDIEFRQLMKSQVILERTDI